MDEPRDGSSLCVACGLCCTGMFHSFTRVAEKEIPSLEAKGLVILSGSRGPTFAQPCARFEGDHCAIYAERPQACRSYRCQLLNRYLAGEIRIEQGQAIVAKVKILRDRILSKIGPEAPAVGVWQRLQARNAEPTLWDDADPETRLDAASLLALICRHFEAWVKPRRVSSS